MPFDRFKAIRNTKNLAYLDKAFDKFDFDFTSKAPTQEMERVWAEIDTEYVELTDNGKLKSTFEDTAEIKLLEARYILILKAVEILKIVYDPYFIKVLTDEGIMVNLNPLEPEAYYKNLDMVVSLSKSIIVEIENKKAQIQNRFAGDDVNEDGEETDDDLTDMMLAIRANEGYYVPEDKITVYEFSRMYKNLITKLKRKTTDG